MSKSVNLGALWAKHRKFLVLVFGGFAVFLGLQTWAASYRDGANKVFGDSQKRVGKLVRQAEDLDKVYGRTISEQNVIGGHLDGFLDKVGLEQNSRIKPPADLDRAATDFPAKFGRVWDDFTDEADKIHLKYPDKGKVRFDLRGNLTEADWIDRYRKLEVVQRVLQAAHELRLNEIKDISPQETVIEEIPAAPKRVHVRYPVAVKVRAPFAKIQQLFEYFQRDRVYLTVELDMTRKDGDMVEGDLLFSGIGIEEPRTKKKRGPRNSFRGKR